jgi:hypothetical protein
MSVFRSSLFLPSILSILDDYHTALDLNNDYFGGRMDIHQLCQALTCPSALRSRDYQRLEYLGEADSCKTADDVQEMSCSRL